MRARGSASPVVFKSPAEIVREVLLSSTEGSPQKCPTPSTTMVPEEFRSPQQATELVKQLQEDYHKLLTKYAEAENTIDRLRLRAKVSLYADPPKPSHSVHMGTVAHGSKVMAFSIPQTRRAEFSTNPAPALPAGLDEAVHNWGSTDGDSSRPNASRGIWMHATHQQLEILSIIISLCSSSQDSSMVGFARLKNTQDALERAYLQAREEYRLEQQRPGAAGPLGDFDPDRAVEGEIFRLGMRLEELKDGIDRAQQILPSPRSCSVPALPPSCLPTLVSEPPLSSPRPSVQAPIPALRTPYPEAPVPKHARAQMQVDAEVSSASGETEEETEELPEPLRHKQLQVEKDFDNLLDQYHSFKSLPESLSMEQLGLEENGSPQEVDGPAAEDAGTAESSLGMLSLKEERTHVTTQLQPPERKSHALQPGEHRQLVRKSSRLSSVQGEESLPQNMAIKARPQDAIPKPSFGGQQETLSRQSSMASMVGSTISEHLPQKPFHQAKSSRSEDQRIVSPETDSGFVGSEASRVSPLTRTPEHHPSRTATPGLLGRSGPTSSPAALRTSLRKVAAPLPSEKELLGMYTSARQGPPRGGTQRHSLPRGSPPPTQLPPPAVPSQTSSPPQWANSITSEVVPDADITSDSDCPPLRARDGKPRTSVSSRQSPARTLTFKGHYTGG
ncbi:AT-hook-containing transcription factor [Chelonia mydas]|uniref:AT-hook-containing transcription factor n=1 Tax=Chelonia mydas TaxID=8469 RepID=M7BLI5_CHEMY|nr:AT-hook-containing transcription factor [Chelonia mydas]